MWAPLEGALTPLCGSPRIHVMAGRVPVGAQRAAVAPEMEETFVENLRYAADLLSKVPDGRGASAQW